MKDKKTEKDLSILENQDVEIEKTAVEDAANAEGENVETAQKQKIKPWIIYTTILAILLIVAAGVFTWYQVTTLATYKGGRVTQAELDKYVTTTLLAQGVTEDEITDMDLLENNLLVSLANEEVFFKQLENLDIAQMTPEEIDTLREESRVLINDYVEANIEAITMNLPEGYTDSDLEKAKKEFEIETLNGIGCENLNDFVELRTKETTITNAYDILVPIESATPTEEEIKTEYDARLAEQILVYGASPSLYLTDPDYFDLPLYTPEGIRLVRHVLITISEEEQNEIYTLETAGNKDEADAVHAAALAKIKPQMDEVLALLDSGEITFTQAIADYNEDEGMDYYPDGYEVCEGFDMYVPEFTEGALALAQLGDYSGLIATTYGYHIIEYYKDIETNTVPYENVSEYLADALLKSNRSDVWYGFLETWPVELDLQFKDEALNDMDIY